MTYVSVLSLNLDGVGATEEINEKPVRITGVPAKIWNDHLQNTSLDRARYSYGCLKVYSD
jgi:hypothetical protein